MNHKSIVKLVSVRAIAFFSLTLCCASCSTTTSTGTNTLPQDTSSAQLIIDSKPYVVDNVDYYITPGIVDSFGIQLGVDYLKSDARAIYVSWPRLADTGTYMFSTSPSAKGTYIDSTGSYETDASSGLSGTLTIQKMTLNSVTGTFNFVAGDAIDHRTPVTVSGSFHGLR